MAKKKKHRGKDVFCFSIFSPDFLPHQAMKSTRIYRGWKRGIFSLMVLNFAMKSTPKDPNRWLKVVIMNCQSCCRRVG
jgi:hypothetical protein